MTVIAPQGAEALAAQLSRFVSIEHLAGPGSLERHLVHRGNLGYLLLFLESNGAPASEIAPLRNELAVDPEALPAVIEQVGRLEVPPHLASAQEAWLDDLRARSDADVVAAEQVVEPAQDRFGAALRTLDDAVRPLAGSLLGRAEQDSGPDGVGAERELYSLVSATASAPTRAKIRRARRVARERALPDVVGALEALLEVRRRVARARGHASALDQVLSRCGVDEQTARGFVDAALAEAVTDQAAMRESLSASFGEELPGSAGDHLAFHLRTAAPSVRPLLDVDVIVADVLTCLADVLPFEVERLDTGTGIVRLTTEGAPAGAIVLSDAGAWPALEAADLDLPLAHVAVQAESAGDGRRLVTIGAAQRLLHEVGHAVNHVLVDERRATVMGLDYLPVERLDVMSMFVERWIHHPRLVETGALAAGTETDLADARRLRQVQARQAAAERAVVSALDLVVHGPEQVGVEEAYASLVRSHGVDAVVSLPDAVAYLDWPALQANPGADFASAWSASLAEVTFERFLDDPAAAGATLVDQALSVGTASVPADPTRALRPGAWSE